MGNPYLNAKPTPILHIDTELTWRGGEKQLEYLVHGAQEFGSYIFHVACPPQGIASERLRPAASIIDIKPSSAAILSNARAIARYCRIQNIRIMDAQTSKAHSLGLMVKWFHPEMRLVVHRRVDYAPSSGWFSQRKYHSPRVDQYIAISHAIKDVLVQSGVPAEKVTVVRSAVDANAFTRIPAEGARQHVASLLKVPIDTPIIGNVAYLTDQKDHGTLLRGLARLKEQGQIFCAYIAGDGECRPQLEQLHRTLNLGNTVQFLGIRQDVPMLLRGTDIFALPSRYEGLGTSLLDAGLSGCALVGSRVGGIPEIIEDEKTGLLMEVGDANALASQLQRLLQDSSWRRQLATNATQWIHQEFSLQRMIQGNLAVYQRLLT